MLDSFGKPEEYPIALRRLAGLAGLGCILLVVAVIALFGASIAYRHTLALKGGIALALGDKG